MTTIDISKQFKGKSKKYRSFEFNLKSKNRYLMSNIANYY